MPKSGPDFLYSWQSSLVVEAAWRAMLCVWPADGRLFVDYRCFSFFRLPDCQSPECSFLCGRFFTVCVCVRCAYWKQCLSVEARWRRVCVASPSVMALSPRVQGVAAVIDNCGFVVFRLRHKPGCVVVAFTFSFFSIVAVLLFDIWRVDVMWFVGSCCCCAANKEVIYSMLEGAQPTQATARTVAGGRPSYHSNCGRVARSVWIFPPSDFQE